MSNLLTRFLRVQHGTITVLNLFFVLVIALFTGVAIDVANAISARTQLQATADAAAHAALVQREWHEPDAAKARAIQIATGNMPSGSYGDVLEAQDIVFGDYDRQTSTFSPDPNSREAVLVRTERVAERENPVGTFLLQLVGHWNWEVRTAAVFETFYPTCLMEGFVAQEVVDIQSNNSYFNGFCIHSNAHVSINNNNYFESGTKVSMPDTDDLVVSVTGNGEDKNLGLREALHEGKWLIKILNRIERIKEGVQADGHRYAQEFTDFFNPINIHVDMRDLKQGNKYVIEPADLQSGRVYNVECNKVDLKSGTYVGLVLITDCQVELSNGVVLEDTVLISSYSGAKAFYSPANIVLGVNDSCSEGGGAKLVTNGSIDFSAGVEIYGSQIIAGGNVEFSSNADGLQGASIVAGGRIDSTSNMNFAFCGDGIEHFFLADYFRLAG
ncbi:MAG: pilus assembly protein TadG-related protein [Paracoccaceae bacterium]